MLTEQETTRGAQFEQIAAEEIQTQIKMRREAASLDASRVEENLIGLSLSGGGIRSGAIGLGIFQGFARTAMLRFFDYLSTVSGGGYAGAYLSSVALQQAADPGTQGRLPITPEQAGQQSARVLKFLDTGKQLNKPLVFANRYLIGLLLTWIVIFSGLIVVASGTAWLFRQIYNTEVQDYLFATGLRDDFGVCMLPPLAMFALWAMAWVGSWIRYGSKRSRALGQMARVLFIALLVTCGLSFAALIGAGDIDSSAWFPVTQTSGNQRVNQLMTAVQTLVLSAILAALLPYLNPLKLFKSGGTQSGSVEKYIYALSSRALVFGVPFLVMAYFVKEDLSGWYARRDGLIYGGEIKNASVLAPDYKNGELKAPKEPTIWYDESDLKLREKAANSDLASYKRFLSGESREIPPLDGTSLQSLFAASRLAGAITSEFHTRYHGKDTSDALASNWEAYPWTRLWYGLEHLLHLKSNEDQSTIARFVTAQRFQRQLQQERNRRINKKLLDSKFASQFLPAELWLTHLTEGLLPIETVAINRKFADSNERKKWAWDLHDARDAALRIGSQAEGLAGNPPTTARHQALRAVADANRRVLELYYGDAITPRTTVLSTVVWTHDQETRQLWFIGSLAVFLISALVVDLNATSCHGFYAKQIAENWIEEVPGVGRDIPIAQLTTGATYPYHLICGCVRQWGKRREQSRIYERSSFLFSKLYCGSERLAFVKTDDFMGGDFSLPDAIAASGGAISPTESTNPLAGLLLTLTNFRLGQWIENPAFRPTFPRVWQAMRHYPFVPARWLVGMLRNAENRPYCLVTDGGYYENLGVEALLRRRCKLIVAVDAGQDEEHQFEDFVRLVRRVRLEHGIQLTPLDKELEREMLDCLSLPGQSASKAPADNPPKAWTRDHYAVMRVIYPLAPGEQKQRTGLMVYMKSSVTGDEPLEMVYYQKRNPAFPHDKTGDQLFDTDQFLSYLQLGAHMAEKLAAKLRDIPLDKASVDEIAKRFLVAPSASSRKEEPSPNDLHWTSPVFLEAIEAEDSAGIAKLLAKRIENVPGYVIDCINNSLAATKRKSLPKRALHLRNAVAQAIAEQN